MSDKTGAIMYDDYSMTAVVVKEMVKSCEIVYSVLRKMGYTVYFI